MQAIKVENLNFDYNENERTIIDASFEIPHGSYTTVIGHNGSGKSTIAKLLLGLLEKKSGSIFIDGIEMSEENIDKIRSKIGIVFQNPDNQFIGSTVRDDIAFGLENHRFPREQMDPIIENMAAKVNMTEFLNSEPTKLSGGQKQRVAIASVLAMNLEIIVFDEATSMLDPSGKRDINKLIKEIHDNQKLTVISITHDIEEVAQSDNVIVVDQGRIALVGKPEEIFKNEKMMVRMKLDIPFEYKLYNALQTKGVKVTKTLDMERMADEVCQFALKK
ncbi:MAG: energy-coupling factor transporter ATPase [Erysipelotrichaceae bacterium]|nr:energy-coupling factor transporter ATPase [Erysipelotrichaceae bacterium]